LREDILHGKLSASLLVSLSPTDLATDAIRKARQEVEAVDAESRRSDWLDEHKEKIQEEYGFNPNDTWEYSDDEESLASQF
jgi:hypothetical protein